MALDDGSYSGEFPEFGAIFMSNRRTKRECLERQLFGLPLQYVDFVKNVRAGMILFLFEHERRELHGVFEAISDGDLNIVPNAYPSSGRAFPAQVQIRVMWKCDPLSENCFKHAIEENYYAAYKFRFGLSREQVHGLLLLFDVRRVGPQKSLEQGKVERRHSRSPDEESLSIEPGNQIVANKLHCTFLKFQSADAQMSSYKSGNTSPRSGLMQLQEEIKQADITESHLMDLGDYIPLSSEEHSEHEGNLDHKPRLKGLYSDIPEKRRSVFSRLKLSLQGTTEQEKDNCTNLELNESAEKVMQNLQLKHDNWVKMRKKGDTETFQNIDMPVCRSSLFSRLSFASEATRKNTRTDHSCYHNTLENLSRRYKKRKHVASFTDHGNGQHIGMTVQANTVENRLAMAKGTTENENGSFEGNMILPAVRSVLCERKSEGIEQNADSSMCQRRSVFSRLSFTSEATGKNTKTGNSPCSMEDVSEGKEKRKYAASPTDLGNSQCISMSVQMNMLENKLAIAKEPVAKDTTEKENGSFEEDMTSLPALTSVSCEPRSGGEIEKFATFEETFLRDLDDVFGARCRFYKGKFLKTYKRRGLSASSSVREPAEKNTSDQGETQQ